LKVISVGTTAETIISAPGSWLRKSTSELETISSFRLFLLQKSYEQEKWQLFTCKLWV